MKKTIINRIGFKLLVLIVIDTIMSFFFIIYLGSFIDKLPIEFIKKYAIYLSISFFTLALIFFGLIFLFAVNRRIKYLGYIGNTVKTIKTQQYLSPIKIKGNDEIAELARDINTMSQRLKENYYREKKQEESKNDLIVAISHDLKTPLTSMIGYLELLEKDSHGFSKEQQDYFKIAYNKSKTLKKLIDELFEYTKLSNDYIQLDKVAFNLAILVNQIVGEHIIFLEKRDINVTIECNNNELMCEIDIQRIIRVIENILKNAEKYSYSNSTLTIRMFEDASYIHLSFENEGDSISNEDLVKIFDQMYRIDKSRNVEIEGSGLGLPISKKIIELHGGKIWAECNGTLISFNIMLPKV